MTIYERIKALRESKGMSQTELAHKVGYAGRSAISKVEKGENDITQTMVVKYAEALGTTPYYLLCGEEEPDTTYEDVLRNYILSENDKLIFKMLASLSESKKADALNYLRYLVEQEQANRKKNETGI